MPSPETNPTPKNSSFKEFVHEYRWVFLFYAPLILSVIAKDVGQPVSDQLLNATAVPTAIGGALNIYHVIKDMFTE